MIGIFIALISGGLMSIQGVFNTEVTKASSVWASASWVQLSALATCLAVWGTRERGNLLNVFQVSPKYMHLGGVIGAGITWSVIKSIAALGPAKSALLIVIAQLAVAYIIRSIVGG